MRRLGDWLGFLFFASLALYTVVRAPTVGFFLLPTFAYELIAAVSFLIRDRARASLQTLRSRAAAYGGTFLLMLFFPVASRIAPAWLEPTPNHAVRFAAFAIWLAGSALVVASMWWLRCAFSIEPAARRLISTGPYRLARHPVYLGYILQYASMWLVFPTAPFATILLCWFAMVLARVRYEEQVLSAAFPQEYAEYCRLVGPFWPRLTRTPTTLSVRLPMTGAAPALVDGSRRP